MFWKISMPGVVLGLNNGKNRCKLIIKLYFVFENRKNSGITANIKKNNIRLFLKSKLK